MRDEQWLLEEKYGGKKTAEFETDRHRLARGEPVAYLIGWQPFLGLKIFLDSRPLIPRPETEWWAEQLLSQLAEYEHAGSAISETLRRSTDRAGGDFSTEKYSVLRNRTSRELKFLDLCAGSGAIGCAALAHLPTASISFGEIDRGHEKTILKNIRENNLDESRAIIGIGDLFEPFLNEQFDCIAANPPYIPSERILPASVTEYEPPQALYAEEDGLGIIRRIALELPTHLTPEGVAWIECDSAHAAAACALLSDQGMHVSLRTDQYDIPRILVVSFS